MSSIYLSFILLISAIGTGCALALPINQTFSPQSLGRNGLEVAVLTGIAPSVGPIIDTATDEVDADTYFGWRAGYGVTNNLDLELNFLAGFFSGTSSSFGVKYQWLGAPIFESSKGTWNSALRIRYNLHSAIEDEDDDTDDDSLRLFKSVWLEDLNAKGFTIGNSFGYYFTEWFGVYFGGQVVTMNLKYKYHEGSETGPVVEGQRDITAYGPFAGLHFNTTGRGWFRFYYTAEVEGVNSPKTYSTGEAWTMGFSSSASAVFRF